MIKTSSGERVDVLVADNRNKTAFGNTLVHTQLSPLPFRDHSNVTNIFSIWTKLSSIYMQVVCCEGNAGVWHY